MTPVDPPGDVRFAFRFTSAYRLAGLPFGVGPHTAEARLGPAELSVRFGPWRVRTELRNIASVTVTGPYAFLKTAGPARLGLTDRSLSLATNGDAGVELNLHYPIPGIELTGLIRHRQLTLTLDRVEAFVALVEAGLPGRRPRANQPTGA